jgi:membrane protein implicated in regulation of membrane protease activity
MTLFLAVGALGMLLLFLTVVADGVFDAFDLGDGLLSGPAIAAFLTSFGFGGGLALYLGTNPPVAVAAGLGSGAAVGAVVSYAARSLMDMPTDATPSSGDLPGKRATVVSDISGGGLGEVSLNLAGQPVKLSARSSSGEDLPAGTAVVVTAALSPTAVSVERALKTQEGT